MGKSEQSLDVRSLQLFVAVMESNSLTEAATKLDISQSIISYALDKLRDFFDDPLLVRSGRGLAPTARARELLPKAKVLLADFDALQQSSHFDPQTADINYTIAANDFQREVLLSALYRQLRPLVRSLCFNIVPSNLPDFHMLRDGHIDMVISPHVPESGDIVQRKLYEFSENCYYDASQRDAPTSEADFAEAHYLCPRFLLNYQPINLSPSQDQATWLNDRVQVITYGFADAVSFLHGTDALAIAPPQLARSVFKDFAHVPFPYSSCDTMYLVWNKIFQKDLKHAWVREQITHIAQHLSLD